MSSSKFYEGLEVVIYIALNSGANLVSSKEICKSQEVMPRHLEPVIQSLVKNKILKGTKGPKGGYTLAKEKRKVTAGDIYRALSSPKQNNKQKPSKLHKELIAPLHQEVKRVILSKLDNITIEDLCSQTSNGKKQTKTSEEFYI